MKTLKTFVRERARWKQPQIAVMEKPKSLLREIGAQGRGGTPPDFSKLEQGGTAIFAT